MDSHRKIMRDCRCKASCVWSFVMLFLTLADGLCCVSYIYILFCVGSGVRRLILSIGPNPVRFHLYTETELVLRKLF